MSCKNESIKERVNLATHWSFACNFFISLSTIFSTSVFNGTYSGTTLPVYIKNKLRFLFSCSVQSSKGCLWCLYASRSNRLILFRSVAFLNCLLLAETPALHAASPVSTLYINLKPGWFNALPRSKSSCMFFLLFSFSALPNLYRCSSPKKKMVYRKQVNAFQIKKAPGFSWGIYVLSGCPVLFFWTVLVRNCKLMTSFRSAASQHFTSVGILHTSTKSMYWFSATGVRLIRSFFTWHVFLFSGWKFCLTNFRSGTIPTSCERTAKVGFFTSTCQAKLNIFHNRLRSIHSFQ